MAVDMFLIIDDGKKVPGETKDKTMGPKGAIDILAWSWGMSNAGTFHTGGGGGAGKANFQDISVTKWVDKASAKLMLNCANGDHFATAELTVRKAGKTPVDYIKIKMEKVLITSVSTGGSGGEERLTENITLNFAKVTYHYFVQKDTGEAEASPQELVWDIAANST